MTNPVNYIEKYPESTIKILVISCREWQELTELASKSEIQEDSKILIQRIR